MSDVPDPDSTDRTDSPTAEAAARVDAIGADPASDAAPAAAAGPAAAAAPAAEAAPPTGAPAPLTSLSALLGDSLEGGAACAADGSCD